MSALLFLPSSNTCRETNQLFLPPNSLPAQEGVQQHPKFHCQLLIKASIYGSLCAPSFGLCTILFMIGEAKGGCESGTVQMPMTDQLFQACTCLEFCKLSRILYGFFQSTGRCEPSVCCSSEPLVLAGEIRKLSCLDSWTGLSDANTAVEKACSGPSLSFSSYFLGVPPPLSSPGFFFFFSVRVYNICGGA